ncbi:response regulator [Agrococcus casei]|uniref:Two component transcriptional regulator, LuxR family n=1 Tax=Agrococcus casei LMG 22410 TaxID=1255656 RepID=A0A1R4GGY6_9MICO|nr:response regulator transcription factor [Agrococcus casei]SJM67439.1 Two component transcriptional regulator, LuxR family [Agrococcus casei LMG 22410]
MTDPIRVIVADDHPVILGGLVSMLESDPGISVVATAADGAALVAATRQHACDVVVTDLRMPGTGGADATRQIRRAAHPPRVLILTTYDSPADVMQAVEAGASGYLLKAAQPREILAAVRAVARGERAMSPAVAQRLSQLQDSEQLTAREVQVLRLMRAGGTNASIGAELGIGAATVKTHVQHIFDKLGVRDRTSAVATGIDLGLLSA